MSRYGALLRHWHRRLGVAASLFLIWLAISGVILNEGAHFGLDHARVAAPWLMHWYGLAATPPERGYLAGGHWLVETTDATLLDAKPLTPSIQSPLGLVAAHALLFVATANGLVLLTPDGQRVEEVRAPTLPLKSIRRIGRTAGGEVAIQDLDAYASRDGETWTGIAADAVIWSQAQALPESERVRILPFARPSLPLSRVLADAHSGRLFGELGPLLIDLAGLAAILLASSGVWMFWRASRRRQQLHPR